MAVAPVMLQYWFRQEKQIPPYLRGLESREDHLGFDLSAAPGDELIEKTHGEAIDTSYLHEELQAGGLVLTHASRVDRMFSSDESLDVRFYYVFRFHYFPAQTAVPREGVDLDQLLLSLEEINKMAYWGVRADLNNGRYGPWISVSCKGRVQRYTAEDLARPEMRNIYDARGDKIGSAPVAADRVLHYLGDNHLSLSQPVTVS